MVRSKVPAAIALLAAACGPPEAPDDGPRPDHVLFLVVDTLRADRLSCYGNPRTTSPTIDALAARGVRFAQAYSQCSWTLPSMISMFTGQYVSERCLKIPEDNWSIAEVFHEKGFATAAFVCNPLINEDNGFTRGFDRYKFRKHYLGFEALHAWIASCAGKRSFTYVHLNDPHHPYAPLKQFVTDDVYGVVSEEERATWSEATERLELIDGENTIEKIEDMRRRYDDEITFSDEQVREILDAYRQAGMLDETVVVFGADHGEGLYTREVPFEFFFALEKGRPPTLLNAFKGGHGNEVHEELIHVPLILAGPGVPGGVVVERPVENLDVVPTLFELFRIPLDEEPYPLRDQIQGTSLLNAIDGDGYKDFAFSSTAVESAVVTEEGVKLIRPREIAQRTYDYLETRVYDLNADPEERRNLAEERPDVVRALEAKIRERLHSGLRMDPDERRKQYEANQRILEELGYAGEDERFEDWDDPLLDGGAGDF